MMAMLALYVDYNARERLSGGGQAVAITFGRMNPDGLERELEHGSRVILYDEEMQCEGILRHGKWIEGWVADLIPGTVLDLAAGEFDRLRLKTKRAALRVAR